MTIPGASFLAERAPRNTKMGRRIRLLFRNFLAGLDSDSAIHQAAALAAAELTVASEAARTRLLAGDASAEAETVRLENCVRRAKEDLAELVTASKPDVSKMSFQERMKIFESRKRDDDDDEIDFGGV